MTVADGATPLSLIIPVYNSARFIEENLRLALTFLDGHPGSELIVVDDCSKDETPEIVQRLAAEDVRLRFFQNDVNRGKGFSVRRAMLEAKGERRVFNDADFTYPIGNAAHVLAALDAGADVAIACRVHDDSRYIVPAEFLPTLVTRHFMGRTFSALAKILLVGSVRDTQAGLKGFTAAAAERIFKLQTMNRFSFDLEVVVIARQLELRIDEVGVEFHYCKEPSTVHFVRDTFKMLRDMVRIKMNVARGRYDDDAAGEDA